jgi:adenosylhomocysteine nucleosidase
MKRVGIIGAMEEEVACLKEELVDLRITKKIGLEFYEGLLAGKPVVVVRSGIGKVNAGVCTQILIDLFEIEYIINTGIAGSVSNNIEIGDVVISTDTVQHDFDVTGFGYPLGEIPRMGVKTFEADSKLVELAYSSCKMVNYNIQVYKGRIASGDIFVSDNMTKEKIATIFAALCTEMEGAAIGQVACLNQIPYVVIRAISDKADGSAQVDYPIFAKQAIQNSIKLVKEMLK